MEELYAALLAAYGPQGWWPLMAVSRSGKGKQPTKTGSLAGYHPGEYAYPRTDAERFEICLGAVFTQNTSWVNVEKALHQLIGIVGELTASKILLLDEETLKSAIKPAGYYNQKTVYVREFARFYQGLGGKVPTRSELLAVKGVGKETADSMLLYAFSKPVFVVDAYTKRILLHHGLIDEGAGYDEVQKLFHDSLKHDVKLFQEFHALLVEHAKRYYAKQPYADPYLSSDSMLVL